MQPKTPEEKKKQYINTLYALNRGVVPLILEGGMSEFESLTKESGCTDVIGIDQMCNVVKGKFIDNAKFNEETKMPISQFLIFTGAEVASVSI